MTTTQSETQKYLTRVSNGHHLLMSDTVEAYGGSYAGFRPHELLEAAFASCLNIWLRMHADKHAIPLAGVKVTTWLDGMDDPAVITFEYHVELVGPLLDVHRQSLLKAADLCPVRGTLSKKICFRKQGAA
jgi:putative redox protein